MMSKNIQKTIIAIFCVMAFSVGALSDVQANKGAVGMLTGGHGNGIDVMLGKAEIVKIDGAVKDVLVADPSIVDVMAIKSNRLYIVGSALGDTNVMALDENGDVLKKINIHVQLDTDRISAMVDKLYPEEEVQITALNDQVVLTGNVSNPATANKIVNLVGHYAGEVTNASGDIDDIIVNMLGVRGAQQVMLRVKIVEVARNALKDLGVGLDSLGGANIGDLNATATTNESLGLTAPLQFANALLSYNSGAFGALNLNINALEQEGIVNTLAEPNLTAISGEQAGFLAGGEFPIPTQLDQNGNLVYEFRPFGVSLNFRPTVMSKDRINMQLTTEVSTATFERNLQLNGINVPTFNVRRAETTVELPSGGTLMIAGLIRSESISGLSEIPGVKDVPIVGDLLQSDTFQRSETELLVMITPYVVEPFAQPKAVAASSVLPQMGQAPAPVQNYGALTKIDNNDYDKPLRVQDLPIQPIAMNELDNDFKMIEPSSIAPVPKRRPSEKLNRQQNRTNGVFRENIKQTFGEKSPEQLMDSMAGFGYMLD